MKLVIGGAGYIGSAVANTLVNAKEKVMVLDDLSTGHYSAVILSGAEFIVGDMADPAAMTRVLRDEECSAAIIMAAKAEVVESGIDPSLYWESNVSKLRACLDNLRAHGVMKVIFSSSCSVYGGNGPCVSYGTTAEEPTSVYGWTKFVGERMIRSYCSAYGMTAISLRYFNAAGAHIAQDGKLMGEDHDPETHLIPRAIRLTLGLDQDELPMSTYTPFPTRQVLTPVRDYVHVTDLARAHAMAATKLDEMESGSFEVYDLGSGRPSSVMEVITLIRDVTGDPLPCVTRPLRLGDPKQVYADPKRTAETLGWVAELDLSDIVFTALDWHKSHPTGYCASAPNVEVVQLV